MKFIQSFMRFAMYSGINYIKTAYSLVLCIETYITKLYPIKKKLVQGISKFYLIGFSIQYKSRECKIF